MGTVRFSLQQPTMSCDPLTNATCQNAFRPMSAIPYCSQSSAPLPSAQPCAYWDGVQASSVQQASMLITTRVTELQQSLACAPQSNASNCAQLWVSTAPQVTQYVANIEDFTVLMDHSAQAPSLDLIASSRSVSGWLHVPNNNALCAQLPAVDVVDRTTRVTSAPCLVVPNNTIPPTGLDVFALSSLLAAADVTLDGTSAVKASSTLRYSGVVIVVNVEYTNVYHWVGAGTPYYTYRLTLLPGANAKTVDASYPSDRSRRTVLNQHGIRLTVIETGRLGAFDTTQLLLRLTTSLSLLAVATVIVDSLALYCLARRQQYKAAKFEDTAEFHAAEIERQLIEQRERQAAMPLPASATTGARK